MPNIDIVWQMYSILFRSINHALTALEDSNIPKAKEILQQSILEAVDLYLSKVQAVDELAQHPEEP